jgi:hypothetical protein
MSTFSRSSHLFLLLHAVFSLARSPQSNDPSPWPNTLLTSLNPPNHVGNPTNLHHGVENLSLGWKPRYNSHTHLHCQSMRGNLFGRPVCNGRKWLIWIVFVQSWLRQIALVQRECFLAQNFNFGFSASYKYVRRCRHQCLSHRLGGRIN